VPIILVRKDAVHGVAARLHGALRRAYLKAVAAMKGRVDLQALSQAIAANDYAQALAILGVDQNFAQALQGAGVEAGIASFKSAVQAAYQAGAQNAAAELPTRVKLNTAFDLLNPRSIEWIQNYSFSLIHQISEESRASIRQALLRAFREGGHPFQQARWIRDSIGLTAKQEKAVANYRSALENQRYSDALRRGLRDRRFDAAIRSARPNPLDQARIDRMVERYREKYVKHRAETIARTESARASVKGQREIWKQAQEQGNLDADEYERVWIVSGDSATCDDCDDLDGETVGLDEEFPDGDPPLHANCRCSVALQSVAKRDGTRKSRVMKVA
jgi:SPP1 gp7 family putative phage head morphogenesis protein